ncbi:Ornithine carbamoyltransferase subunit I [Buchnera aphidicola (Tetraneura ulmi)]|uniref:ornithine carbamoyltransferase n=1 Tax=Buchnera aphidicola TaxID=9 RepID=UPI0034649486
MNTLYKKNFLKLSDYSVSEIKKIINFSIFLKKEKEKKNNKKFLKNKKIVLIFEKESTRTRCSFEVASFEQGANITYLGPKDTHLNYKESIEDTTEILSNLYDLIVFRGNEQKSIETFSKFSKIPVLNALTNKFHPTQLLADLLTIQENLPKNKKIEEIICAYVGDAKNNISNSLIEASILIGFKLRIVAPKKYWPNLSFLNTNNIKNNIFNKNIICTENISDGVNQVDFIYTDVWVSMNEKLEKWEEKILSLKKYQINDSMLELTKNPKIRVLHCLPALHDLKTKLGKTIMKKFGFKNGIEITDKVFRKNKKIILEQSENKLHTIKSMLIFILNKN